MPSDDPGGYKRAAARHRHAALVHDRAAALQEASANLHETHARELADAPSAVARAHRLADEAREAADREHTAADRERENAAAADASAAEAQLAAAAHRGHAVVWSENDGDLLASGTLSLLDGHVALEGACGGTPRHLEFEAADVKMLAFVSGLSGRLNNSPTVDVELRDGRHVLLSEVVGFGILADIVDHLNLSRAAPAE